MTTLERIAEALEAAVKSHSRFVPGAVHFDFKSGDDPVTEADRAANHLLREILVRDGEGWLSEESVDDHARLAQDRVWVVDPLDGTREFVQGIPEWCVSIGLVENGRAVAGGIANPATQETIIGSIADGVQYNGKAARTSARTELAGASVVASRSEVKRGEWKRFEGGPFVMRACGSVAYKLGLVAAGLADATWTLVPKHEWDVAAGVALVEAAGGFVEGLDGLRPRFNNPSALLPGLIAGAPALRGSIDSLLAPHVANRTVSI